jgi:hypothetical protein
MVQQRLEQYNFKLEFGLQGTISAEDWVYVATGMLHSGLI